MGLFFFELDDINWLPSATPYQRACALADIGRVLLTGPSVRIDGDLRSKVDLVQVHVDSRLRSLARLTGRISPAMMDAYTRAALSVSADACLPVWVCSTNLWVLRLAIELKKRLGGIILVDIFDPIEFPREIAVLKGRWLDASRYWVKERKIMQLLRNADIVIRATALDLNREYGIPSERIISVLNGVRPDLIRPDSASAMKTIDPHAAETTKLGYVGQLDIQRGLGFFCQVVNVLRRRGCRTEVHLVGPITKGEELRLTSRFDPSRSWLHLWGPLDVDEAMKILSTCDILVDFRPKLHFASCQYPIKIGEYLALGKPIIANNLPGIQEMVGSELARSLVVPDNMTSWVQAIERLIAQPEERAQASALALVRAREITWPHVHSDLMLRLKELEEINKPCRNR